MGQRRETIRYEDLPNDFRKGVYPGEEPEFWYVIAYQCPYCHTAWEDEWSSAVDCDCPQCGQRDISANDWDELEVIYRDNPMVELALLAQTLGLS